MPDTDGPFSIPSEHLERIVARASVLQNAAGELDNRQLSEAELVGIGREVGLSPEYVRRAIAEYRAERLSPPPPPDHPAAERILGPGHARVRRIIDGTPETLHRGFERRMRERELMQPLRLRATESVWQRDTSLSGKVQRALDLEGRGYELAQLKSVEVAIAPASPDTSMVTLTADLSNVRSETATNWGIGLGVCWLVLFLFGNFFWSILTGPALLAALAGAVVATRVRMDDKRRRTALVLEVLIDQLEAVGRGSQRSR